MKMCCFNKGVALARMLNFKGMRILFLRTYPKKVDDENKAILLSFIIFF